jgi:elongation factor Ts
MNNNTTQLIKELRDLTAAGMKDCKDALQESNFNLQKAVDIIKTKGLNIVSERESKVAAEGLLTIVEKDSTKVLLECNSQTDFVANSKDFTTFTNKTATTILNKILENKPFNVSDVEEERKLLVSKVKENVVVRRWWVEQAFDNKAKVFSYVHSNNKIGVVLTLMASSEEVKNSSEFNQLGNDLVLQIAAMNPLAVSSDKISSEVVERQKNIFEAQLKELNKPQASWSKILEGKNRKWFSEVCLVDQESITTPKTTVGQVIKNLEQKLGKIEILNFVRCVVGEGIQVTKTDFVEEVSKMSGV